MFGWGEKAPEEKPLKEGWLKKEGANVKNWKNRYFKLYKNRLEYYKKMPITGVMSLQGTISFHSTSTVAVLSEPRAGYKFIFSVSLPQREYYISAENNQDRQLWIEAITSALRIYKGGSSGGSSSSYAVSSGRELSNVTAEVTYPETKTEIASTTREREGDGFATVGSPRDSHLARQLSMPALRTSATAQPQDGGDSTRANRRKSSLFTESPVVPSNSATLIKERENSIISENSNSNNSNNNLNNSSGGGSVRTRPPSATVNERPKGRVINIEVDLTQISTGEIAHSADAKQKSNRDYKSINLSNDNNNNNSNNNSSGKGKIERVPYTAYSKEKGGYRSNSSPAFDVSPTNPTYPTTTAPASYTRRGQEEERLLPSAEETSSCQCCNVM